MSDDFEFILKPVLDKNNTLFVAKKDGRRKKKPVHIEFKINGGVISGYFELKRYKQTNLTYDVVTGGSVPVSHTVEFI